MNYVTAHTGISSKEIATIALSETLQTYLEEIDGSEPLLKLCREISDQYQNFDCPIKNCR